MGHGAWGMDNGNNVDCLLLTITNRPCVPHITELSLLFQTFQLNPRLDSFQPQIRQQIPHNQHCRTIIKLAITKYKS